MRGSLSARLALAVRLGILGIVTAVGVSGVARAEQPKLEIKATKFQAEGSTVVAEWHVTNPGKAPAKLGSCTAHIKDGQACNRLGEPALLLHVYTRQPVGKGPKEFYDLDLRNRLQAQRVVPPGGEATLTWKLPLSGLAGCAMTSLSASLDCSSSPAEGVAWPPKTR